ncbi:hypothetical protein ABKN59_001293 [Abortiporus biennis]
MSSSPYRRGHRKRISALRLSSDSTVPTLPLYTSPPWQRTVELPEDPSDRPPDYTDSAEEADADTDDNDSDIEPQNQRVYVPSTPPLSFSPRRLTHRRSQASRSSGSGRRHTTSSTSDPYLDSLLARSVHALEMSNALLQSSMSTQTQLSHVLSSDSAADESLETHALVLSSRIKANDNVQSWMNNLEQISRGVDCLFEEGEGSQAGPSREEPISRSLPTNGLVDRIKQSHLRRPSLEFRRNGNGSGDSQLQYTNHDRHDLIAPPPRALTMYVDSTDDPSAIILPHTLGLRSTTTLPPTPIPSDFSFPSRQSECSIASTSTAESKRAVDVLSFYASSVPASTSSFFKSRRSSISTSPCKNTQTRRTKSPPPPITITGPTPNGRSPNRSRSRSVTPLRTGSPSKVHRPMTPPIEELSASSESSASSKSLHVDRTLESLRNILEKQPAPTRPTSSTSSKPPLPRPSLLSPPSVAPSSGTSTATASVSRLFTKSRHHASTRPPSPPRHSSLKVRSTPATPTSHSPSPSVSMLSIPDAIVNGLGLSSGHSTPKRISFAELPESYSSSRPHSDTSPTRSFRSSKSSKSSKTIKAKSSKRKSSSLKAGDGNGSEDSNGGNGWWTGWLLGAAGSSGASGLSMGASRSGGIGRQDDRLIRSSSWSNRPGFGNSLEDWAV